MNTAGRSKEETDKPRFGEIKKDLVFHRQTPKARPKPQPTAVLIVTFVARDGII
jgi:hypothetical protein